MEYTTDFRWQADERVRLVRYDDGAGDKQPAVLVLPGGGYAAIAPREGAPVAAHFTSLGYRAFVLEYSTRWPDFEHMDQGEPNPHTVFPEPLRELAAAVAYLRRNADAFGIDGRIILMGFSAGAHLAANYMNLWNTEDVYEAIADPDELAPALCVLGYPAVELDNNGMMAPAIFGRDGAQSDTALRRWSARWQVGAQTPPCFLFHSVTDPMVPVQQSLDLAQALENAGVPYELHLFGCGGHAYGLGQGTHPGAWPALADGFIRHILADPDAYDPRIAREASPF